ncbi:MAG TPA: SDR family oxidoreductase [Candidatus Scatomorpha merdigallinarum]|nr:SDR family oxidoreductase [Candidatus Scatomorpha merdigallinarum]
MFKDKIAVVTGGTRGIGFAVAEKLLPQGAKVVLFGSKQETVDSALDSLRAAYPGSEVSGMWPELRNYESVSSAMHEIAGKYGRIDMLVCCAGITGMGNFYDYTPEYFERVVGLNLFGTFNCAHSVAPIMKEAGGGVMLFSSSNTAMWGTASGCAYPVSKCCINALARNLGRELAKDNIRVNAVAPGLVDTDMVGPISQEVKDMVAARNPQGRFAPAEEVAKVYMFMLSDDSSRVTSETLPAAGGGMD